MLVLLQVVLKLEEESAALLLQVLSLLALLVQKHKY
jgi:hypothetical protein